MDPITVAADPAWSNLLQLLQSGGSAAAIIIIWIALQLKKAVEGYLTAVTTILSSTQETLKKLIERVDILEREVERFSAVRQSRSKSEG